MLRNYAPGDVVWVQDYHLMLLPALLKLRAPKMKACRPVKALSYIPCHIRHSSAE